MCDKNTSAEKFQDEFLRKARHVYLKIYRVYKNVCVKANRNLIPVN
jgi:thymidylate kinase